MFKIAILGTENSHARTFCNIIYNGHTLLNNVPFSDFEVIGLCGDNPEENELLREITGGRAEISDDCNKWVGKVDAVMVTARHVGKHFEYAKKYIESGVPAFIDAPITIDPKEAVELATLAKKHNAPLFGGSMCGFVNDTQYLKRQITDNADLKILGGSVAAPVSLKNDLGDFFFYSQHLVQIMCEIFGYDIESVIAVDRGEDSLTFIARYADFDVTGNYGTNLYSAAVYTGPRIIHREIDIRTDMYFTEFRQFEHVVRNKKMLRSYEDFIKPVFILNAIDEAVKTGKEVKVEKVIL